MNLPVLEKLETLARDNPSLAERLRDLAESEQVEATASATIQRIAAQLRELGRSHAGSPAERVEQREALEAQARHYQRDQQRAHKRQEQITSVITAWIRQYDAYTVAVYNEQQGLDAERQKLADLEQQMTNKRAWIATCEVNLGKAEHALAAVKTMTLGSIPLHLPPASTQLMNGQIHYYDDIGVEVAQDGAPLAGMHKVTTSNHPAPGAGEAFLREQAGRRALNGMLD